MQGEIDDVMRRVHILEAGHDMDGWPAVKMRDLTLMRCEILELRARLNTQGVAKWIDVNDEMPETEDPVLMYMPDADGEPIWPGYFEYWSHRRWLLDNGMPAGRVTHWMHFPLPPKDGAV